MKITIDTTEKKITLHEPTTFKALNELKKILGENFNEYEIQATEFQYIPYNPAPIYPPYDAGPWWKLPTITFDSLNTELVITPGTFTTLTTIPSVAN